MSKYMTPEQQEDIKRLRTDIGDAEQELNVAEQDLNSAIDWVDKRKIDYAEKIIALHNYIKKNNL